MTPEPAPEFFDWIGAYMLATDRNIELAEKVGQLKTELRAEKMAHLAHCRELEAARTLADYRQGKLERREGKEDRRWDKRSGLQQEARRDGHDRRVRKS